MNPLLCSRRERAALFALWTVLAAGSLAAGPIEPWADQTLPVKEGLALWLDAGREARAWTVEQVKPPEIGGPASAWHDASGNKRNARQEAADAQPAWADFRAMVFAGEKYFEVRAPGWTMREATIFVIAQPMSNEGGFRALVAAAREGANDYRTGFNLDFGSRDAGGRQEFLNAEGAGFRGPRNLLKEPFEFGDKICATLVLGTGPRGVKLFLDGRPQEVRDRTTETVLNCDRFFVGARSFDNAGPPKPRGFFHGNLFEVLVYDRALPEPERQAVETYLAAKYVGVGHVTPPAPKAPAGSVPLLTVRDAPIIQPLVPGFTAHKLPLQLTNINFLRYRPDGRLYAGAYDGKIYLLSDTDGDGLEDRAELFWSNPDLSVIMGMALTPPGYPRGEGIFIATPGRVLLILDRNQDGRGDEALTVADGWPPPQRAAGGRSDALGVTLAPDGRLFFGLGTNDFSNAYGVEPRTGRSGYRLDGERGTIQEVSADFSKRTTLCTGIRFTVGLAFNRAGDLFATEQEGATWLANGNPFDELLHIQPGRHYGFPPRHPRHLPDVVDEPSTFDYEPQHQSTVGLCFDEPLTEGGAFFGPAWWRGDALVSAMSRGQIYRTKLIKTAAGYVAKNETFARLTRINIDQAISPQGTLVVTLHSGTPDWGTGPSGLGELWQIAPAPAGSPQPALAWSASPTELRVAFDQPLPTEALAAMQGHVSVTQGRYVQAGDRFEIMRPGYQAVKNQLAAPRFGVAVQQIALADAGRTLVITTPPRSAAANYAITVAADIFKVGQGAPHAGELDLVTDLTGLEAEWRPANGGAGVKAWLPHPDFAVSREFTAAGGAQKEFWEKVARDGAVTMQGQLDLGQMLQPAIQPGSKLDWEYPAEEVTAVFEAARPFQLTFDGNDIASQPAGARYEVRSTVKTHEGSWIPFTVAFAGGSGDPALQASWFTAQSATPRPFPLRRVLLPYARAIEQAPIPHHEDLPQLSGGDWHRGKALFYGQATCFVCHPMRGEGGRIAPDLTNLIYRDYDSVLRDIREPSATINPEYVAYTARRQDGTELAGVLLTENPTSITLGQPGGASLEVPRTDLAGMKPLGLSLMPEGLDKALSAAQLRDLMTFLLTAPPQMEPVTAATFQPAPLVLPNAPPPRKRAEVKAILGSALTAPASADLKPLRILLCASEKDLAHIKPGYHDYPLWRERWSQLLGFAPGLTVETADIWPSAEQWQRYDLVVFNSHNPAWAAATDAAQAAELARDLDGFLARGGGLVFLHYSINGGANADLLASRLGLAWERGPSKFRHRASDWVLDKNHPLAAGFTQFQIPDESYWNLAGDLAAAGGNVLATSLEDNAPRPQMWTREAGPGRVFVSIPGHFAWTYDDPLYRILIFRGMMWSAHQPIDRLAPLVLIGARVE